MPRTSATTGAPSRLPAAGFAAVALAWLSLVVASPYVVSRCAPTSACFRAGGLVYLAGRALCHQRADRSFHAWGVQLPVCGRCFGLYLGAALGALMVVARRRAVRVGRDGWRVRLLLAVLPTVLSVCLELAGIWMQTPLVRAAAALPLGFVIAWLAGTHIGDLAQQAWHRPWSTGEGTGCQ